MTAHSVTSAASGIKPRISEELGRIAQEPFLPVEAKLVVWSLSLGLVLLAGLVWVSSTFFAG